MFCDVDLLYVRDCVAFGFLTEVLFVLSTFLDTDLCVLVTFSFRLLVVLTELDLVDLEGVDTFVFDLVLIVLLSLLDVVLGVVTLVLERVVVALSLDLTDLELALLLLRVVLTVEPVRVVSARRVVLVLVISAFLRVTVL